MKYPEALCCNAHPRAGSKSILKTATIPFVVHDAKDRSTRNRNYYDWAPMLVHNIDTLRQVLSTHVWNVVSEQNSCTNVHGLYRANPL